MKLLPGIIKTLNYHRTLGEKAINQCPDKDLFYSISKESNSIAIIVKHISGNMLSRWTNFLTEDGEKKWRKRDDEFVLNFNTRDELMERYHAGWDCMLEALDSLKEQDLKRIIYIRNQGHTVIEAINRQLAHIPYHVGQIVFLSRYFAGDKWESLSIPKGESENFNKSHFEMDKQRKHYTDDLMKK